VHEISRRDGRKRTEESEGEMRREEERGKRGKEDVKSLSFSNVYLVCNVLINGSENNVNVHHEVV
jgi:hypothetical protein